MERLKIWKSVSVSIFWMMIIIGVCSMLYAWATELMTKPSTISFIGGVGLVVVDVMLFFAVMDYQAGKIKFAFRKIPENKDTKDPLDSTIQEREYTNEENKK